MKIMWKRKIKKRKNCGSNPHKKKENEKQCASWLNRNRKGFIVSKNIAILNYIDIVWLIKLVVVIMVLKTESERIFLAVSECRKYYCVRVKEQRSKKKKIHAQ